MSRHAGKRITVFGLGRTGVAAARYLQSQGAQVYVTEAQDTPVLQDLAEQLRGFHPLPPLRGEREGVRGESTLEDLASGFPLTPSLSPEDGGEGARITVELGGHREAVLEADLIVLSPGVPPSLPILKKARERGIPVVSELEAVWEGAAAPIIAVTGTNGKTTTTSLIHHILTTASLKSVLCGNNDLPLSEALRTLPAPDWYVVEVSSYQLESALTFKPRVAAVLNVTPDHPRHGGFETYAAIKASIYARQGAGDIAVINLDDPTVRAMATATEAARRSFGTAAVSHAETTVEYGMLTCCTRPIVPLAEIPIPGQHNLSNTLAAVAIACALDVKKTAIAAAVRTFRGVPHRIERVRTLEGVDYFNDSKSTNVDSLRVALEAFTRPLVLIAGGRGKDSDYSTLTPLIRAHVHALVLMGEDAAKMAAAWGESAPVHEAASMAAAVSVARGLAREGDVVLLSPGCASFDWYNNFEERGEDFRACVLSLPQAAETWGGV